MRASVTWRSRWASSRGLLFPPNIPAIAKARCKSLTSRTVVNIPNSIIRSKSFAVSDDGSRSAAARQAWAIFLRQVNVVGRSNSDTGLSLSRASAVIDALSSVTMNLSAVANMAR